MRDFFLCAGLSASLGLSLCNQPGAGGAVLLLSLTSLWASRKA